MYDRRVPNTRGNVDIIAVAASGVWVIDAKKYRGRVERRSTGLFTRTHRLFVDGRDRTNLVHAMGWQVDAVRAALGASPVPVHAAVCFVESEWSLFSEPFRIDGVWVVWRKRMPALVDKPGPLPADAISALAMHLASSLPPVK